MDLLGVFLLALIGGVFIGVAIGRRAGRTAGYRAGLQTDWSDASDEAGA